MIYYGVSCYLSYVFYQDCIVQQTGYVINSILFTLS